MLWPTNVLIVEAHLSWVLCDQHPNDKTILHPQTQPPKKYDILDPIFLDHIIIFVYILL